MNTTKQHKKAIYEANKGNDYSSKENRSISSTLKRKLVQSNGELAEKIVMALIDKASTGDVQAIRECLDRVDGKVINQTQVEATIERPQIIKVITGIDPYVDDEDDTLKVITGFDDTD
jgi:hypothetical protein